MADIPIARFSLTGTLVPGMGWNILEYAALEYAGTGLICLEWPGIAGMGWNGQ